MNKRIITISALVSSALVISIIAAIAVRLNYNVNPDKFIPPSFDKSSVNGAPDTEKIEGYSEIKAQSGYTVGICGKLTVTNGSADVYLTSAEDNTVWIKVRMIDENNNILGETGLLKPGKYVKSIKLNTDITESKNVVLKIMAYEPDTYYSAGAVNLKTTLNIS